MRPDGLPYDADDPEWLRWNYATVVWGIATGHELYHPTPLRNIDRYYGEFVRVGHALGGTDLPSTKAETLDCLRSYLPRLALTHGAAMFTGPNLQNNPDVPQEAKFFDWAIRDSMPDWAAQMLGYQPPHPVERAARRAATWSRPQQDTPCDGSTAGVPASLPAGGRRHDGGPHGAVLRLGQRPDPQP